MWKAQHGHWDFFQVFSLCDVRKAKAQVGQHVVAQGECRHSAAIAELCGVVEAIAEAFHLVHHIVIPINELPQSAP